MNPSSPKRGWIGLTKILNKEGCMSEGLSAWKLVVLGGPLMLPLLFCSIFAVAIIVEKLIYFQKIKMDIVLFKKKIFELIKENKIKDAVLLCDQSPAPVAHVVKAGIVKFGSSREEIKESIEEASLFEIPKLENRMSALATIAHISPLLGLLGTVVGMATSFHAIHEHSASMNPLTMGDLAGGVYQALLTTVVGLMIAIPTYVAYNFMVSHIHSVINEMERTVTELINYLSQIHDVAS
jgi:biopolymer transport protein ExbB